MPDAEQVAQYIGLKREIKRQETQLKKLKKVAAQIEEELIPTFKADQCQRLTLSGWTAYLDRKVYASAGGDMDGLVNALQSAGEFDLVKETVNGNTLSGWVREFDPDRLLSADEIVEKLPKQVRDAITVSEKFTVRVVKG